MTTAKRDVQVTCSPCRFCVHDDCHGVIVIPGGILQGEHKCACVSLHDRGPTFEVHTISERAGAQAAIKDDANAAPRPVSNMCLVGNCAVCAGYYWAPGKHEPRAVRCTHECHRP